ncbi:MAG: RelA/SpoT family protein [Patescibacteria group bacterium]
MNNILNLKSYSKEEQKIILKALDFAEIAHKGQKRFSGEDYIIHPIEVAKILIDLGLDWETIVSALLHDVPEDTACTLIQINKKFGENIARLVDGVTKVSKVRIKHDWQENETVEPDSFYYFTRQMEILQKMFIAMSEDIRVIIIKLADRLHNIRTIQFVPEEKKIRIATETLEIFAPLADRLGIGVIKGELEDRSFPIIHPIEYESLNKKYGHDYEYRKKYIIRIVTFLKEKLDAVGVETDVSGRAKHLYSLYKKLGKYQGDISRIYDLVALRIIVDDIRDCYAVMGYIHQLMKPLPSKIKDYIAMPKPNGYQSIHTTVFGLDNQIIEIQIRTHKMHEQAEFGIAAHWHYTKQTGVKEDIEKKGIFAPSQDLNWTKELANWHKYSENPQDFDELKRDFFGDRIFVFTPAGDVCNLPSGSSSIDFAYMVHTDLGDSCIGAKVNGKMIEFSESLHSGDIVQIITRKNSTGPKRDWLKFVKTSEARMHIKHRLNKSAFKN